jgi:tRNA (uracil-5-)-methyltransferase
MFILRHLQVANSNLKIFLSFQRAGFTLALRRVDTRNMSTLQRERSPGETSHLADERPLKKARLDVSPSDTHEIQKNPQSNDKKRKPKMSKRTVQKLVHPEPGTPDDVLWHEIQEKLGYSIVEEAVERGVDLESPVNFGDIVEVEVTELSSSGKLTRNKEVALFQCTYIIAGDSIAALPAPHPPWAIITPFALPGEARTSYGPVNSTTDCRLFQQKIRVKITRNGRMLSHADLLEIVQSNSSLRDMDRVKCKYFGVCAGCQYQVFKFL